MHTYDIAVIGAGPAGSMAAIRAAQLGKNVVLLEKNSCMGKKILLTGKGRCNITNIAGLDTFLEKFGKQGPFLRSAFISFSNQHLMDFLKTQGLELKIERQGRVFPSTDRASSLVGVLKRCLADNRVQVAYERPLRDIKRGETGFVLNVEGKDGMAAQKVILATGGASFKMTGSTGDGFPIAKRLGHTIAPLLPALVPLKTKEAWVKALQGLSLKNIRLHFVCDKKKISSEVGEMLFTHFGISGPLVLEASGRIVELLQRHKEVKLFVDLKPGLTIGELDARLLNEFRARGDTQLKNLLKTLLPQRLIDTCISLLGIEGKKVASQITQKERYSLVALCKALGLTVVEALPLEEAMVTAGGVSTKEIDPRTMESRIVPGLYFAGEIIEGCASSGGYNLQQAFSTGYLAGESAACASNTNASNAFVLGRSGGAQD